MNYYDLSEAEEARLKLEDLFAEKYNIHDMSDLARFSDDQLREMLNPEKSEPTESEKQKKPAQPVKPVRRKTIKDTPRRDSWEYVEHESKLHRLEHWSNGGEYRVPCGDRVRFKGRTVSAGLVLHWVRTGEMVQRVPRASKAIQAAIRINGRVIHLGRFATIEEAQAAKTAARALLGKPPTK